MTIYIESKNNGREIYCNWKIWYLSIMCDKTEFNERKIVTTLHEYYFGIISIRLYIE